MQTQFQAQKCGAWPRKVVEVSSVEFLGIAGGGGGGVG